MRFAPASCALLLAGSAVNAMVLQQPSQKTSIWTPSSWRGKEAKQIPVYPDAYELDAVERKLAKKAPLVFAGEVRTLQSKLAEACKGYGFVLFGGDCAESFDEFSVDHVRDTFRVILQMALILTFGGGQPVIKIGRMGGHQFAKPRPSPTETIDGVTLPSYQGASDVTTSIEKSPSRRNRKRVLHIQNACWRYMIDALKP